MPFGSKLNVIFCPKEEKNAGPCTPWSCLAFAIKLEHPTVRRGSLDPVALQKIFVGWNRRVPHGIKIATFRDDGEVEEVFTSTTVRTCDTVFPLFGGAGTKPDVEIEEAGGNLAPGEEMQDDRGREQFRS